MKGGNKMNNEVQPTYYCTLLVFKFPYTDEEIEIKIFAKSPSKLESIKKDIEYLMSKIIHKYR